jgi:hypothetical protein
MQEAFEWAPYAQYQHPIPEDELHTMTELCQYGYLDFSSETIDIITGLCPNNFIPSLSQNYWRWWTRNYSVDLYEGLVVLHHYVRSIGHRYDAEALRDMICTYFYEFYDGALDDEDIIDGFSELI